jgi:hypothetical protein
MNNDVFDSPTLPGQPENPQGCSSHNEYLQNPPPDDEADFGPLRTCVIVPRGVLCFFVVLSLLEGSILFWIFGHLWCAVPPGAR